MYSGNVKLGYDTYNYSIELKSDPELDKLYKKFNGEVHIKIMKPQDHGTDAQNRAAHALMSAYYLSGCNSAPENTSLEEFKVMLKLAYGPYWDIKYQGKDVRVPKSWSDFTKEERMIFIDGLINEINQSGAYSASVKIQEIIKGMKENNIF